MSNGAEQAALSEIEVYARLNGADPMELASKIRAIEKELISARKG